MSKMLKYQAKNAKNQISITNFTSVIIKGILGHLYSYTRQVEEISLPGDSTYDVFIKSKIFI